MSLIGSKASETYLCPSHRVDTMNMPSYCRKGHLQEEAKTITHRDGKRRCRTCNTAWRRKNRGWQGRVGKGWLSAKMMCPRGHIYTEDNTIVDKRGYRTGREC